MMDELPAFTMPSANINSMLHKCCVTVLIVCSNLSCYNNSDPGSIRNKLCLHKRCLTKYVTFVQCFWE